MIHTSAVVESNTIGKNVTIKEFAIIRKHVVLGNNVIIHPHVVIEDGVEIGENTEIYPGVYIGKPPKSTGSIARPITFRKQVNIGPDCLIGPNSIIYYDVVINNNTLIGDGASIREKCKIGSYTIIGRYVTVNYATEIGNEVKIMDHSWLAGNMVIDDHVFISGGVLTANDNLMGEDGYEEGKIVGPIFHMRAHIGAGAIVLPGISIGEDSIVAAGAVVTKDIAPSEFVKGIPARSANRHQKR
jgi:UDP-3-O-[3-hydroxymyristoyl] glucosamine N-acyltransferase